MGKAFVTHRRRCIDDLIARAGTPARLRELQGRIEALRAVSASPSRCLQEIQGLLRENIDQLVRMLELIHCKLDGDDCLAADRERIRELISEARNFRVGGGPDAGR